MPRRVEKKGTALFPKKNTADGSPIKTRTEPPHISCKEVQGDKGGGRKKKRFLMM